MKRKSSPRPTKQNSEEDFWLKVDKSNGPTSCWIWAGTVHHLGYGVTQHHAKQWRAHRLAYFLTHKKLPFLACHTCDEKLCVNPAHLYDGDHKSNAKDMYDRGRRVILKGESSPLSKLTEAKVLSIRSLYANGVSLNDIAKEFSISFQHASAVAHGKKWGHIKGAIEQKRPKGTR